MAERGMTEEEAMAEAWTRKVGYVMETPGLGEVFDCERSAARLCDFRLISRTQGNSVSTKGLELPHAHAS